MPLNQQSDVIQTVRLQLEIRRTGLHRRTSSNLVLSFSNSYAAARKGRGFLFAKKIDIEIVR